VAALPAITVRGLGKRYPALGAKPRVRSLRDALVDGLRGVLRRAGPPAADHWALKGVDLEVGTGEVMGVVGGNGSGKSTLLKILSQITEPTTGRIEIRGRIASLLEVGTGFHNELTGRQNIYLSGAILGMRRSEIDAKLDRIVAFAEVERFIDSPVKHYSSGMYMRLGFSVAAHLDGDILLVDEVLAVGDAAFQARCLGRMNEVVRDEGRTIVFVSHNLQAVASMCTRAVLLSSGEVAASGPPGDVIAAYLGARDDRPAEVLWTDADAPGKELVRLRAVRARDASGAPRAAYGRDEAIRLEADLRVVAPARAVTTLQVVNEEGVVLFETGNASSELGARRLEAGLYRVACLVPGHLLNEGLFGVTVTVTCGSAVEVRRRDALGFRVRTPLGADLETAAHAPGIFRPTLAWTGERLQDGEGARAS